jgi:signal transduction histidine kinase/CheY-like chemotaxis protein
MGIERKRMWTIRAVIVLVVLVVLILSVTIYRQTLEMISWHFNQQQLTLADQTSLAIHSFLEEAERDIAIHSSIDSIRHCSGTECYAEMEEIFSHLSPSLSRLLRVDASGNILYGLAEGPEKEMLRENLFDDSLFRRVAETGKTHWTSIAMDRWGKKTLSVGVPVTKSGRPEDGMPDSFDGLLLASIKADYLSDTYIARVQSGVTGYSYVLDSDGRIIIHSTMPELVLAPPPGIEDQAIDPELHEIALRMLNGERGTGTYAYQGSKKYVAYSPLTMGDLQWSIAVTAPVSDMAVPIRTGFWIYLLSLAVIMGIFTFLAYTTYDWARQSTRKSIELEHLHNLSSIYNNSTTRDELIENALAHISTMEGIDEACICMHEKGSDNLKTVASHNIPNGFCQSLQESGSGGETDPGAPAGEEVIIDGQEAGKLFRKDGPNGFTWFYIPLTTGGKEVGVMTVGTARPNSLDQDRLRFLRSFAEEMSLALDNQFLFEVLKDRTLLLEQANRVKSDFLSVVSHELRTPLAVIIGFLNLLLEGRFEKRPGDMKELSEVSLKRAHDLEKLINSILDLTRIEEGKIAVSLESIDPKATLREVHALFLPQAERINVDLILDLPKKKYLCQGDPVRLRQILDNLISNALKFTPAGGRITLGLETEPDEVVFSVSDTGPGIPESKIEAIFERFYQLDSSMTRKYGGTGLGLAISRELARLQEGRLWAVNNPDGGATFFTTLPAARAGVGRKKAPEKKKAKAAAPGPEERQSRILMVDDDDDFLKMTALLLEDRGYKMTPVDNALDGLRHLYQKPVDLVILDLIMPGFSGKQFLAALREDPDRSRVPVVIMTGAAETEGEFDDNPSIHKVLIKPVEASDLLRVLEEILGGDGAS